MEERSLTSQEENLGMHFVMTAEEAARQINELQKFVKQQMVPNVDYGVIPGTDRPTLKKPGAEKLAEIYGLAPLVEIIKTVEDFDRPLFDYTVKVTLVRKKDGSPVAEGIGSCNSMENKYRYRWVFESQLPKHINPKECLTREIKTQRGKIKQYRIENDDIFSLKNTILKMAKKRALIDAVLSSTRSSGIFTQDLEDLAEDGIILGKQEEDSTAPIDKDSKKDKGAGSKVPRPLLRTQAQKIKELYEELGLDQGELISIIEAECGRSINSVTKLNIEEAEIIIKALEQEITRREKENFEEQNQEYNEVNKEGQGY